jgi:exopolysaccharide production protein ExoQ
MEHRAFPAPINPAVAVSGLLTRLALFLLVVLAPFVAMFSRRAVAIVVPVATALLVLSAALDGKLLAATKRLGSFLVSRQALVLAALVAWAAVTLWWTPRTGRAASQLLEVLLTLLLFVAAIACLRGRTRRSDVNLIPIGAAIAAITLAAEFIPGSPVAWLTGSRGPDRESQRAAMLLALLAWPAIASLTTQGRRWQGALLAVVTAISLWLVRDLVVIASFIAGAIAFIVAIWRPRAATYGVGAAAIVMLVLSPLVGWVMARYGGFLLPREGDDLVGIWRDVTYSLPSHLFSGFGFDSSGALERGTSRVLLGSPRNAALQIWLELGLIGVALACLAIAMAIRGIEGIDEKARPAALAVCSGAGVMMFSGLASWQNWWLTSVGLTAITLAFLSRRAPSRIRR